MLPLVDNWKIAKGQKTHTGQMQFQHYDQGQLQGQLSVLAIDEEGP